MGRGRSTMLGLALLTIPAALAPAPAAATPMAPASEGTTTWVTGDLTGDGRDEIAGFSPLTGGWTVGAADAERLDFSVRDHFATTSGWLTHLAGDFSGDGVDEVASFHRNGNWVVSGFGSSGMSSSVWGRFATTSGWLAHVAGDFSGDGVDEVASFHRNGNWVVSGFGSSGMSSSVWGRFATTSGWLAHAVGDYSGDGVDEVASFHRNRNWVVSDLDPAGSSSQVRTRFSTAGGWLTNIAGDLTGNAVDEVASFHGNGNWIATDLDRERSSSEVRGRLEPPFHWRAAPVPPAERERMRATTYRPGCPVGLDELRAVDLTHHDLDGGVRPGRLIVHAEVVDDLEQVFAAMFRTGFPVAGIEPAHRFGGDDEAIMADNVSHAFNCRAITGGTGWSEHAYGTAIDLNPIHNPYRRGDDVKPSAGAAYLDRTDHRPGMILEGVEPLETFDRLGWRWGGRWTSPVDYMHLERPR